MIKEPHLLKLQITSLLPFKILFAICASLEDCPSTPLRHVTVHLYLRWPPNGLDHVKSTCLTAIIKDLCTV